MSAEENLKAAILSKIVANIDGKISDAERQEADIKGRKIANETLALPRQLKIKIFSDLKYNKIVIKTKNMSDGKKYDFVYDCLLKGFENKEIDFSSEKITNKILQLNSKDLILLKDFLEKNNPSYVNIYKDNKMKFTIALSQQNENNIEL